MRRIHHRAVGITLLLVACSCSETGGTPNVSANAPAAAANSAGVSQPRATQPAAATAGRLELRLASNGLAAGQPGLHSSATYEFGRPRAEIVAAIAAIRGPASGTDSNAECGAGPMDFTRFGDLALHFQEGNFVGWELDGPGNPPIREEYGLAVGTPRTEIADGDRDQVQVEQSTLGTEFTANGINGLLASAAPDARVTTLWAGAACHFR